METFPAKSLRSRKGVSREDCFYLGIENKKDFLDYFTIDHKCTDLHIKFLNSVMDGKLKFVKHALNIGSIRREYDTMRAAINLACRFGQSEILDSLILKVHDNFFRAENLNFVAVVVAGLSEARRLEANQEPSGILDTIIKYARKSFDQRTYQWVNGKIELDWTAFGKYKTTPFMELCAKRSRCMGYVIKKILDAQPYLLDVNQVLEDKGPYSALTCAIIRGGEPEVVKIIMNKMRWEGIEDLDKTKKHHIQSVLATCLGVLSTPDFTQTPAPVFSIIHILIEKCFRATQENSIGHNNACFMKDLNGSFMHEHFDAMIYEVIEEERRIAHASGKITWYDLYDLKLVEGPWTKQGQGPDGTQDRNFYGDQMKRYLRSSEKGKVILCDEITLYDKGKVTVGIPSTMYIDILLTELEKKEKCWSCGYREPELLVCKQCRQARYCDALCQEEDWGKHQQWCTDQKNQMKLECKGKTVEDRKAMRKNTKNGLDEISLGWSQVTTAFQMLCNRAHNAEYS